MSYAIIGLIFVLLIVLGVLSAKNWHWLNIVFLILTFVAGVAATGAMAKTLQLRGKDMAEAVRWEVQKEANEKNAKLAVVGSPDSISYDRESLRGINELLTRETYGRGRVWSSGTVSANEANRVFVFPGGAREDNQQNSLSGVLVYAFADQPVDGTPYPVTFVGTFRVASETPTQIDIEPVFVASNEIYADPDGTWSLFEKMPADRRDTFKKIAVGDEGDFLGDNFDLTRYRNALVTQHLPAEKFGLDPESKEYEELIDRIAFDGLKLGEIANWIEAQPDRKNARFEPLPEEVFVEFRFDKKYDSEFDVDAPGSLASSAAYVNGKAIDPALQAGKRISFSKEDTIMIDQLNAEGYQRSDGESVDPFSTQYEVTEVDRYYFRQLRDYPYMLADLTRQSVRFSEELVRVEDNNVVSKEAQDDANEQVQKRADIIVKLDEDRQNMESDLTTITSLKNDRTTQLAEIQQRSLQLDQQLKRQYDAVRVSSR